MESTVKLLWSVKFFFFAMVLFFIWGKMLILSNRIKKISKLRDEIQRLTALVENDNFDEEIPDQPDA